MDTILVNTGTTLPATLATIDSIVDDIKAGDTEPRSGFYDTFTDTPATALIDHTPDKDPTDYGWRSLAGGSMVFDTDGQSIQAIGEPI